MFLRSVCFMLMLVVLQDVEGDTLESTLTNEGYLVVSGRVKGAVQDNARTLEIKKQEATEDKDAGNGEEK